MLLFVVKGDMENSSRAAARDARSTRTTRSWRRWLLVPLGAVVGIALVETGLRLFLPQSPSWLGIHAPHPRVPTFAFAPRQHTVIETGESRWEVHTDAEGHRVDPGHVDPPGEPIVVWLGDSFTFGYGVDGCDTFVGRIAREPSDRARHVNTAVGGHGPREYALLLEDLLAQGVRPAAVVACVYAGNDFQDVLWEKTPVVRDGIIGHTGGVRSLIKVHLHTYRLISKAWQRLATLLEGLTGAAHPLDARPGTWCVGDLSEAKRRLQTAIERMQALCRQHGCSFHVVVIPHKAAVAAMRARGEPGPGEPEDGRQPVALLRALLQDLGVPFTDVTPDLAAYTIEETYFSIDSHFRPFGHAVVARRLGESVPRF